MVDLTNEVRGGYLRKSPFKQYGLKVELGGVGKEWLDVNFNPREECVQKGCEELSRGWCSWCGVVRRGEGMIGSWEDEKEASDFGKSYRLSRGLIFI